MGHIRLLYKDRYEFIIYADNVKDAFNYLKQYKKFRVINPDENIMDEIYSRKLDFNKFKLMINSISIVEDISLRDEVKHGET